jgi:isovaleryl-CoA dehydrogenase
MIRRASARIALGPRFREHGQIQRYIAEGFAEWRSVRAFVYDTARRLDLQRTGQRVDADAAKLVASQVGKRVADAAIQVLGGYGYMGENVVERLWRDAKLLEIGGGTLEAHHKNLSKDLCRDPGAHLG